MATALPEVVLAVVRYEHVRETPRGRVPVAELQRIRVDHVLGGELRCFNINGEAILQALHDANVELVEVILRDVMCEIDEWR